jgi:hypothetical protein
MPFSGLSWLARYIANVRALVILYLLIGALPTKRFRQLKQVAVVQVFEPHPMRSCVMYLGPERQQDREPNFRCYSLLHEQLEVVATASPMDGVDAPWVLDLLDVVSQFGRSIERQPREWRFLPQTR